MCRLSQVPLAKGQMARIAKLFNAAALLDSVFRPQNPSSEQPPPPPLPNMPCFLT
jgi:hypothetical protein